MSYKIKCYLIYALVGAVMGVWLFLLALACGLV